MIINIVLVIKLIRQLTEEVQRPIKSNHIMVRKRSGKLEPFDIDKMTRTVSRAGTPFSMSRDISKSIGNSLPSGDTNSNDDITYADGNMVIPSIRLRELVITELVKRGQSTIAESYSGYSKKSMISIREDPLRDGKTKQPLGINTHEKQFAKDKDNKSGRNSKIGYQE